MATPVRIDDQDRYGLSELRDRLPEVVRKARATRRAMVIAESNEAVAAIVDIEELERLHDRIYDLEEALEIHSRVRELEVAEARGEATWYTHEEILAFQQQLTAKSQETVRRRAGAPASVAGLE